MGARIIEELGIKVTVVNIDPSTTIEDVPHLSMVGYKPLRLSFGEALDIQMLCTANFLMMIRAAHEITLCNEGTSIERKETFFRDLNTFIRRQKERNVHNRVSRLPERSS